ncbi:MAG: hypothetical protein GY801_09185 [bacterium]|nr:hypothetical protein [bacterium]
MPLMIPKILKHDKVKYGHMTIQPYRSGRVINERQQLPPDLVSHYLTSYFVSP